MAGGFFFQAFTYFAAAVVAVPVAKRLGLGSVLGYLLAGVFIGPFALGLVGSEGEDVMHFAEFGVVLMLFLVGLELEPSLLWRMRVPVLGLGGLQVALTAALFMGLGLAFGLPWQQALAVGLILALSSTAIVLQTLAEKGWMGTGGGRSSFAVLLFQDIAVIPMLAVMPLLATMSDSTEAAGKDDAYHDSHHGGGVNPFADWIAHQPGWVNTLFVIGMVVAIIVAGRYLLRPVLRIIARTHVRETFTAFALLLVIGIALIMNWLGVSPALGTFLAGVVLANSEYRHELESDIEPFKGILLGVFFIAVGAAIDFSLIVAQPVVVTLIVIGLIVVKAAILFVVGSLGKLAMSQRLLFTLALAQGGEFAFVLLGFALSSGVMGGDIVQLLTVSVALTMGLTPLILIAEEKLIRPRFAAPQPESRPMDEIDESAPVILAGFGRFGNYVGRLLRSQNIPVTVIDSDPDHIDFLRKIGIKAYFGDVCRHDLLESAGAKEAKILILALENAEKSQELIELVKRHFPNLKIFARAVDRPHLYELIRGDADYAVHQHGGSAIRLATEVMKELGFRANRAERAGRWFLNYDREMSAALAEIHSSDEKSYLSQVRQRVDELEAQFAQDARMPMDTVGGAWDNTALRKGVAGDE
ncbi:MAG: monovalent cation:proton antiporter-2 (CPA2) family protein [Myxococcota bacterium]